MTDVGESTDSHPPVTPSALLDAAADLITKSGWLQGSMGGVDRGFCLFGAMDHAWWTCSPIGPPADGNGIYTDAEAEITILIRERMIGWNDAPGRTKEEVVAALRMAAARIRSRNEAAQPRESHDRDGATETGEHASQGYGDEADGEGMAPAHAG